MASLGWRRTLRPRLERRRTRQVNVTARYEDLDSGWGRFQIVERRT